MIDVNVGGIGMEIDIDVCERLTGEDGYLQNVVRLHFPANQVPQDVIDALKFIADLGAQYDSAVRTLLGTLDEVHGLEVDL